MNQVPFIRLHHPPASSAREMAHLRGTPLEIGGKSMLFRCGTRASSDFRLFVLSSARRVSARKIRHALGIARMRLATPAELLQLTTLTPGCIPPFGAPIFELPLYVDASITQNDEIAFSPGQHTCSLRMKTQDYLQVAAPQDVLCFSLKDDQTPGD